MCRLYPCELTQLLGKESVEHARIAYYKHVNYVPLQLFRYIKRCRDVGADYVAFSIGESKRLQISVYLLIQDIFVLHLMQVVHGGALVTSVCHSQPLIVDLTPPILHFVEDVFFDEDFNILAVYYEVTSQSGLNRYIRSGSRISIPSTPTEYSPPAIYFQMIEPPNTSTQRIYTPIPFTPWSFTPYKTFTHTHSPMHFTPYICKPLSFIFMVLD